MRWLTPEIVTPPSVLPVSLAAVKAWLRAEDDNDHDSEILGAMMAAAAVVQNRTGLYLAPQIVKFKGDGFGTDRTLLLPRAPVRSLVSVIYYDSANASTTFDAASYALWESGGRGLIELASGYDWPATYARGASVAVTANVGFVDWNAVPHELRTAVKIATAMLYRDRENPQIPDAIDELCGPHRLVAMQ